MAFPHDVSKYQLVALIGKGASSEVYQARCLTNDTDLAIKLIDLDNYSVDLEFLRQEVAFWSSTQHANIVEYYGSFVDGKNLYILMEFLSGGSVYDIMRFAFQEGFNDEMVIATILKSITEALAYIHQNGQIHRDIKPGNAIIGEDGVVKLGDFGVAATLLEEGQRKRARYTQIGTPCYMAPEVLEGAGHTQKADIWSLGITAIELATGAAPYASLGQLEIVQKILKAPPPQLPRNRGFSDEFRDFVRKCMNFKANRRPDAVDLLGHPFMQKASEPSYIVDYVLSGLPPIGDRYEQLHEDARINWGTDGDKIDSPSPAPSSSCPVPVWSFHDDEMEVKKGRFRIQKTPSQGKGPKPPIAPVPGASAVSAAVTSGAEITCEATTSQEVIKDESPDLAKKVDALTEEIRLLREENRLMREELAKLTELVVRHHSKS